MSEYPLRLIMKQILIAILILVGATDARGQSNDTSRYAQQIQALKNVKALPYICRGKIGDEGCGDSLFWDIVAGKMEIVPFLIAGLDDSTRTSLYVPNFGGIYTVADVAFFAMCEIIDGIPTLKFLEEYKSSDLSAGGWPYWNYTRQSHNNRVKFKNRLARWFEANKDKFEWKKSTLVLTGDCSFQHPNGGHFVIKE